MLTGTLSCISWDPEGSSSVLLKHVTPRVQLVALGERFRGGVNSRV